jgi:phosphatidylglycerophosphate synthase
VGKKMNILIKADRYIDNKPAFAYEFEKMPMIRHTLKTAHALNPAFIVIKVNPLDKELLESLILGESVEIIAENLLQNSYDITLDAATLYRNKKLKAVSDRKSYDIDKAILWKIYSMQDLEYAANEFNKDKLYPISRYFIRPWAHKLARILAKTLITANQVTTASFAFGMLMSALFLVPSHGFAILAGICCWIWTFLDHVDGYLARLKKQQSVFGAYLDTMTGIIAWNLAFMAIAVRLYVTSKNIWFLFMGLLYIFGDYMFNYTIILKKSADIDSTNSWDNIELSDNARSRLCIFKKIMSFMDDFDIRIHFLIIAAMFDALIYPFVYHLLYVNFRWILNITNEWFKSRKS